MFSAGAFGASTLIVILALWLALALSLSPLFIWKWTKANNRELKLQTQLLKALLKSRGEKANLKIDTGDDSVAEAKKYSPTNMT